MTNNPRCVVDTNVLISAALVKAGKPYQTECRDPKDDMFLELAVGGQADYIISGDTDLLDMNPFRGLPIVRAADFLEMALSERT